MSAQTQTRSYDARDIARMLAGRASQLASELLPGGKRDGHEWRCGSLGGERGQSLGVHLTGEKAGVWMDFATGECGDALDLVAAVNYRGDKGEALKWARSWLGLGGDAPVTRAAVAPRPTRAPDDSGEGEIARVRAAALAMWLQAKPTIADTPVDFYLRGRGIDLSRLGRQPRALRFHPGLYNSESQRTWPAMVAAISGIDGTHVATHRTWLAVDAGRWRKAPLRKAKMVLGRMQGGSIRLWRGASGKSLSDAPADDLVVLGEGIETCLSIALAVPEARVLAGISLGNLAAIVLPQQLRSLTLAAENDTAPEALRGFIRAQNAQMARGLDVRVARSPIGTDFNDALVGFR